MDGLRLAARRAGTTVSITFIGDLDLATKPHLIAYLHETLRDSDECVLLDLGGLTFIDAGGIGVLVGLRLRTRRQGADLILINNPDCIQRLLFITGLDEQFAPARPPTRSCRPPTALQLDELGVRRLDSGSL